MDLYSNLNLIDETMDNNMFFEARGKRLIDLDIQDLIEYKEFLLDVEGTDFEREAVDKRIRRLEKMKEKSGFKVMKVNDKKIMLKAIKERDEIRMSHPHYNYLKLPQWMLMHAMKLQSVENNVRKNQMNRLGSTLLRARPVFEFNDILEFATERFIQPDGRITTDYPYFRNTLERDRDSMQSIIKRCAPQMWFNEFNRLPNNLKKSLRNRTFMGEIKKYYFNRCQHQETELTVCSNCNRPNNNYRLNHSQVVIENIRRIEDEMATIPEIADDTLNENEILEVRRDEDGHIAYNMTERAFATLNERLRQMAREGTTTVTRRSI